MAGVENAAAAWLAILEACEDAPVGQYRPYAARVREHLRGADPAGLRPAAERGAALLDAGLPSRAARLALAAYAAVSLRRREPVPERILRRLLERPDWLVHLELVDLAGESLRACDPAEVDRRFFVDPIDVRLIGYVGGAERAARLVAEIRTWPRGAFSALKQKARARGQDRALFARRLGDDAKEFTAHVVEGLAAFGDDAVGPIAEALAAGTPNDAILHEALRRIGGGRASGIVGDAGGQTGDGARALDDSNGEAWASMAVSRATLDAVLAWWERHLGSGSWYSPRPAFGHAVKALAHVEGAAAAAAAVLERIDQNVDDTIGCLLEAFGERIHAPLAAVAREGRAKDADAVLRALHRRGILPAEVALEAGASERSAVRDRVLALVLAQGEAARDPVLAAIGHRSPHVRAVAARVVEVRGWAQAEPVVRAAEARETHGASRFVERRALAVLELAGAPAVTCAQMDATLARFAGEPRPDFVVDGGDSLPWAWADNTRLSAAAIQGFLMCACVEDEIAPSPIAQRTARMLDPASGDAFASAIFVEKPNMSRRAHAFCAYASVMCMSEQRLEEFVKRTRRRTSGPLYRQHMHAMLLRRATPMAVKYVSDFPA
jgi:hypothetical protein